jgi:hypothetical protein
MASESGWTCKWQRVAAGPDLTYPGTIGAVAGIFTQTKSRRTGFIFWLKYGRDGCPIAAVVWW